MAKHTLLPLINDTSTSFQMKQITAINWLWFVHFTQRGEDAWIGGGVQLVGHLNLLTFGIEQHDFLLRELLIKSASVFVDWSFPTPSTEGWS